MLDVQTYRANEQLAKAYIPSWRVAQIHNLDHFERVGFPVRLSGMRELGLIIDTMQENRFEKYMNELGGLSDAEYRLVLRAAKEAVQFQLTFLPHREPVLPISTILSAFALYKKILGANPACRSILEIGPGCGYLSFFLHHHATLRNYSQIEACESFYILQNLVNLFCFGWQSDERALPQPDYKAADIFVNPRSETEFSPHVRVPDVAPLCVHYPWWRIGELVTREQQFDLVTSNANLLEFNTPALDDYLSLLHQALNPEGVFLVQCTGGGSHSVTVEQLLDRIFTKGFAPLMFVTEGSPRQFPKEESKSLLSRLAGGERSAVTFTTSNAVFVRSGHPLFEKYYSRNNLHTNFIAPEPIVQAIFFAGLPGRRSYDVREFLEATEAELQYTSFGRLSDRNRSTPGFSPVLMAETKMADGRGGES